MASCRAITLSTFRKPRVKEERKEGGRREEGREVKGRRKEGREEGRWAVRAHRLPNFGDFQKVWG
jgi:hypothetical protein